MNNNPWYVTTHHWDEDCCNFADVKFFPSEKAATDYATEQRDKFIAIYESDKYRETYFEVDVYYPGSDALAASEEYKIGEVRVSV